MLASTAAVALAAPALAQESDTLKHVVANGTVVKAKPQGEERTLQWTYGPDGTFSVLLEGQKIIGKYWIYGDTLCTQPDLSSSVSCIAYPRGKEPGDEFTVMSPTAGEFIVKINR